MTSVLLDAHIWVWTLRVCPPAGMIDWDHRDPFDRLLAATALTLRLPLISADHVFDGIVPRLW